MVKMRFLLDILFGSSHLTFPQIAAKSKDEDPQIFKIYLTHETEIKSYYTIIDIPSYQKIRPAGQLQQFKRATSPLYQGFLIDLRPFENFDTYFQSHFDAKARRNYRRQGKKLQNEIQHQRNIFCGEIEESTLDLLFDQLKNFLENRFDQKEVKNYEIPILPLYRKMFGKLLPDGNAIIFSRFDKEMPICIGIGFIDDKTLYLFNIAYNVEYSQYGLGNQLMIDVLEWCFENNIAFVDMGRGDFLHKRYWVNSQYTYLQINLFDPKNLTAILQAYSSWVKNNIRFYLIIFLKKLRVHQLAKILFLWRYRAKRMLIQKQ